MVLNGRNESISTMKKKISITIDESLLEWVDSQAETVEFSSRSHVFEVAIARLKETRA